MKTVIENFLDFEQKLLNNPDTFFPTFEAGFKERSNFIWKEYIDWQSSGGKTILLEIKETSAGDLYWNVGGEEWMGQRIDFLFSPFTKDQYKNALTAVYSFLKDRPQYYRYRKMEGMFNPLKLLLYKFL